MKGPSERTMTTRRTDFLKDGGGSSNRFVGRKDKISQILTPGLRRSGKGSGDGVWTWERLVYELQPFSVHVPRKFIL